MELDVHTIYVYLLHSFKSPVHHLHSLIQCKFYASGCYGSSSRGHDKKQQLSPCSAQPFCMQLTECREEEATTVLGERSQKQMSLVISFICVCRSQVIGVTDHTYNREKKTSCLNISKWAFGPMSSLMQPITDNNKVWDKTRTLL